MSEASKGGLLNLPNQLTIARIVLSVVWFVILSLVGHGTFSAESRPFVLNLCAAFFVIAVCTDFLDGYFARKWNLESTFGRIADPFADKIIVCGGFIMLTGISELVETWYALLIVVREFLISGLRSYLEAAGVAFGAALSGKLKMILQSIAIPAVLLHEANFAHLPADSDSALAPFAAPFFWITVALLAVTLLLTLTSCVDYLRRAVKHLRG